MAEIITKRMYAQVEGNFVVFLIGMRVNRWWKVHKWWPVTMAMPRMVRELAASPSSGFRSAQMAFGNPTIMVQYWSSFDALEAYAKNPNQTHLPAWAAFNRRAARNGDVGIWHETFLVHAGEYESIYNNMPRFGLGRVGELMPATGSRESAGQRFRNRGAP
jgi:Domain of unknown function (DUF4188)